MDNRSIEQNCERLFEYLKSILYDTKTDKLELDELDGPFQKLAAGMQDLHQAVEEAEQETERLNNKVYYDAGTGIHNRLFFDEHMAKLLAEQTDFVLCYMDLDDLKYVNDNFGHMEGDRYIRAFTELIGEAFEGRAECARIGGDEFGLILPDCPEKQVEEELSHLRETFAENDTNDLYPVGFSYGVARIAGPKRRIAFEEILKMVDERMYSYKKENKQKHP